LSPDVGFFNILSVVKRLRKEKVTPKTDTQGVDPKERKYVTFFLV
jgi:hypothetical protein